MISGKVFLSSTAQDLESHRAAILSTLTQMGERPLAMEDFGARPGTAADVCAQLVAESALVVVVSAWRYGSAPKGEQRSYTELEYDTAVDAGRPILVYLVDPDHPWPPKNFDRGEKAEQLARFKSEKLERRVAARFTSANDLAAKVCADVARELHSGTSNEGSGALLNEHWARLAPEVKQALLEAFVHAVQRGKAYVSTDDVLKTLRDTANTATPLMQKLPAEGYKPEQPIVADAPVSVEALRFEGAYSSCVSRTLARLAEDASNGALISAVDVAADLLIHGRGDSVARFRRAKVDSDEVNAIIREAKAMTDDPARMRAEIVSLRPEEQARVAYRLDISTGEPPYSEDPVGTLMQLAASENGRARLLGEVLRCQSNQKG